MIEINRAKSEYVFRQNPWNPLIIDRKKNSHRSKWEWFRLFRTEAEAREALMRIEKEAARDK